MKTISKFSEKEFGISDEQKSFIIGGKDDTYSNRTVEGGRQEDGQSYVDYSFDNGETQACDVHFDTQNTNGFIHERGSWHLLDN